MTNHLASFKYRFYWTFYSKSKKIKNYNLRNKLDTKSKKQILINNDGLTEIVMSNRQASALS